MCWKRMLPLFLAVLFALPAVAQQAPLRYKFEKGAKNEYTIEQVQKMDLGAIGSMNTTNTMDVAQTVDSVDSSTGHAKVKYRVSRMRMKMEGGPLGTVDLDTNSKEAPEGPMAAVFPLFKMMTESDSEMIMSPLGEIVDFKFSTEVKKKLEEMPQAMGGMFSGEAMKQMMRNGAMVLPKEIPTTSTKWDTKLDMDLPTGKIKTVTNYTYAGQSEVGGKKYDKINMAIDMKMEAAADAQIQMEMKTKESTGTVLFDNVEGRVHSMETKTVTVMVLPMGEMNMEQKMTMKLK